MFTQECLLRNVGEAKMHVMLELTKLGYSPMYMKFENNVGGNNMVCEMQTWHCTDSDNKPHCIDCGENIDLFLAIAALRDDTDKGQWFICVEEFISTHTMDLIKVGTWQKCIHDKLMYSQSHLWKKATVEELIKFYNK